MVGLNKLTQKLLSSGFTKENPPSEFRTWDDFYGGWQYTINQERNIVFKTPCGCVGNAIANGVNDLTSYMGVDWCLENDNALVACPFSKTDCKKRDKLLYNANWANQTWCNTHIIHEAFDYDKSIEKIKEDNRKKYEQLKADYIKSKNGYVCEIQLKFDEKTGEFKQRYNPFECVYNQCHYCTLRKKEIEKSKGNVFYDVKTTRIKKGIGFFDDEKQVRISKGNRLFEKSIKLSLAEEIAKRCKDEIIEKVESRYSQDLFFAKYYNIFFDIEVLNIRAEKRESRDIDQDLQDIAEGIKVVHASDVNRNIKKQKQENKLKSIEKKKAKFKKLIILKGFENVETSDKRRIEKMIEKGIITDDEFDDWNNQFKMPKEKQLSLFESEVE